MSVHFHSLEVAEIVPETTEANSIRFDIPPELRAGLAVGDLLGERPIE